MRTSVLMTVAALFVIAGAAGSLHSQAPASEVTVALMCSGPGDVAGTTTYTVETNSAKTYTDRLACAGDPLSNTHAPCASCHGLSNEPARTVSRSYTLADGEQVTGWHVATDVGPHGTVTQTCSAAGTTVPAQAPCRGDKYGATVHIN